VISKLKQAKTTRNISLDIKLFRFYVYYLTIVFPKMKVELNLRNALMSYVLLVFRISHFRSTCCSKPFDLFLSSPSLLLAVVLNLSKCFYHRPHFYWVIALFLKQLFLSFCFYGNISIFIISCRDSSCSACK